MNAIQKTTNGPFSLFSIVFAVASFFLLPLHCTKAQLVDGDFDNLPIGTAPDDDMPAGAWHFPQNYIEFQRSEGPSTEIFTIVPTNSIGEGGVGNSLSLDSDLSTQPHLTNLLNSAVTTDLIFRIETYVPTGGGNGSFYLSGDHGGGGFHHEVDRGPQVSCFADGTIVAASPAGEPVVVGTFDFDQWLQFELHISLEDDKYDLYYGPRGGELNLIASDLGFRSGPLGFFDRVSLVYFGDAPFIDAVHQYFDNLELISETVVVMPDSYESTQGIYVSGDINDLLESDEQDLELRPFGAGAAEFTVKGVSPYAEPTAMEVTLEAAVSPLLSNVTQTIELFDYVAQEWVEVDFRRAGRVNDDTAVVAVFGDLSRFVEVDTLCVEARIRFISVNPRRRFVSGTDQFNWVISP